MHTHLLAWPVEQPHTHMHCAPNHLSAESPTQQAIVLRRHARFRVERLR